MKPLERSGELITDALELLDQADDLESQIRAGGTVTLNTGEQLRGESALPRIDAIRHGATIPLAASLAINLERIANALEAGAGADHGGGANLDPVPDSELIAELARRHHPNGLPG